LTAGIFERHDKSRFELIAISLGVDDQSRLRGRMIKAFDRFHNVKGQGSRQIAALIRELEVDIAVDLGGYTSDARTEIFCHRPAPIHVNFLGYPGTLGTRHMDYILADRHVIPEGNQAFFSEQVMYLPDTYMPTASSLSISERTPTREECGLPATGMVFCAFSHDYKISPAIFDVWMRILRQVPDSTLWLMSRGTLAQKNLRLSAEARGVRADRLVFASRVPMVEDHLARYRLADVFLDTFPYNAHTTAADALLAGLPVVTCMGEAFPSRVAGSLLHSCGLAELATQSIEAYENLILKLATESSLLDGIKSRLMADRAQHPLFDADRFCRGLEGAFLTMWQKHQASPVHDA
jgi:predicted O-linked N-acetylglucosamine transferase (SPINDLY family)